MRKSLWSISRPEPENSETGKNIIPRRPPVRIPGNLMTLTKVSVTKAGPRTVCREPMRIEKTPQGRRFVRRNIINEIGSRTGGEISGAVAKKFAQKDSAVLHAQGQGSAQTTAMAIPTPQSSVHTRNGAASTVAVVSAAAQTEVAAFPPWAWKPPPHIKAPQTPILLTGKKPSAETIRVADAFIARSQRALEKDVPALGIGGKSSPGFISDSDDVQHMSASHSATGYDGFINIPLIEQNTRNINNASAVSSNGKFSYGKALNVSSTEALNIRPTAKSDPPASIDLAPNAQCHRTTTNEFQGMPLTTEKLKRAVGDEDAAESVKSSPMLECMRKSLASVVDSPIRRRRRETEVLDVAKHSSMIALPYANPTKYDKRTDNITPSETLQNVSKGIPKPGSSAIVFTSPVLESQYESPPVQSEILDRSLQVSSPAPDALMTEIYSLVAEIRATHEEHIRREEQQIQRMARLEHLTARIAKSQGFPARRQQPLTPPAVPLPTVRLALGLSIGAMRSRVSCNGKDKSGVEMPAQGREVLLEKQQGLEEPMIFVADNSPCIRAEVAEVDKLEMPVEKSQGVTEARHSSRLQDRRLKLGATTPIWLIGRSKKRADAVTKNPTSPVSGRKSQYETPTLVDAKSEAHFNSGKASRVKTQIPVGARGSRAKSEAPSYSEKRSQVKTPKAVSARSSRAKSEAPSNLKKASQVKTPIPVAARRSRAKSEAPTYSEKRSQVKTPIPVAARRSRAKSEAPTYSEKRSQVKTPIPVAARRSRAKSEAPTYSEKRSQVKTQKPVAARRSRAKSEAPSNSGKASRGKTPTPVESRRRSRAASATPLVSKRGRPSRSQSPNIEASIRERSRRSQSPTPAGSAKGRYRRSRSPVPHGSGRGRKRYSQSPMPMGSGKGRYRRSQSPVPRGSGRGRNRHSQSPMPMGSGRGRYRRSQSPVPRGSGRGRNRHSQSPMPMGSGRGRYRRSQSPTPIGSGKRKYRHSQSPTSVESRRGRYRHSQSPTPMGSGMGKYTRSQSSMPMGSGMGRYTRSQSSTPMGSGKGRHTRSQSPTPMGSRKGRDRRSQSPMQLGSGKGMPKSSQSSAPVVPGRGQPKSYRTPTALISSSPEQTKTGTKRLALKEAVSSAKRVCSTRTSLEWEASNPFKSPIPCNTKKTLGVHWDSDSPLATPLDITVVREITGNANAGKSTLKNTIWPGKGLNSLRESHGRQLAEHAGSNGPVRKDAAYPYLVLTSEQNLCGMAPIEHSYSLSPWTAKSLVADYRSPSKSPCNSSDKYKNRTGPTRVISIRKVHENSSVLTEPTSNVCIEPLKTTEESSQIDEESPKKMKALRQACFESPKRCETIGSSILDSPGIASSNQMLRKSPKSVAGHLQNPVVSLERFPDPSLVSASPDFSRTLSEFWCSAERPKRPNQAEMDLLMNSPLYAWMSSPAAAGTSRQTAAAKSIKTPSNATQMTTRRVWRPSDLVKGRSNEKARKSIAKNPFRSNYKLPTKTLEDPGSLLPIPLASAKKSSSEAETKQAGNRKSLIKYQMLRKSFPKLMMTPVNTPVSRSRINAQPLDSAAKTSRNVQAMLELLEDA